MGTSYTLAPRLKSLAVISGSMPKRLLRSGSDFSMSARTALKQVSMSVMVVL